MTENPKLGSLSWLLMDDVCQAAAIAPEGREIEVNVTP